MEKANKTFKEASKKTQKELDSSVARFMKEHEKAYKVLSRY
jgi:hypothetical protein